MSQQQQQHYNNNGGYNQGYAQQQQPAYGQQGYGQQQQHQPQQQGWQQGYAQPQQHHHQPQQQQHYSQQPQQQQHYSQQPQQQQHYSQQPQQQQHRSLQQPQQSHHHQQQQQHHYTYRPPQSQAEIKQYGPQKWETSLCFACCAEPITCFVGYCCPWCCVCHQRKKLLMDNMDNYHCCAGMWGPSCTKRCDSCTKGNETCCLCLESFCCMGCAVHGNRYMVRSHYGLNEDCCDVFLMWLSCLCHILACLLQNEDIARLADLIYYIVIGCMLAQHQHQMSTHGYPNGSHVMK